jgi:hypothetical protein
MLRQASTGNDTLLGTVHTDTERPTVVVLVQHPDELTSVETKFILHGRLEVKLNTMNVVRTRSRAVGLTTDKSASNRRRTGRGWARRRREVFRPSRARRNTVGCSVDAGRGH